MKTVVDRDRYQPIHIDKLSRQLYFSGPKWTTSREEHKLYLKRLHNILTLSQRRTNSALFAYSAGSTTL
jgi:hypothetical protein